MVLAEMYEKDTDEFLGIILCNNKEQLDILMVTRQVENPGGQPRMYTRYLFLYCKRTSFAQSELFLTVIIKNTKKN